jgi:tetratricopeptide (TPR) repeat protein
MDNKDILNDKEKGELECIFKYKCGCYGSFIDNFSRKIYDLFVRKIIFDPTDGDDLLYYLGVYYKYIERNYDLAKKYLLMAIDKGREATGEATGEATSEATGCIASNAMFEMGSYYYYGNGYGCESNVCLMNKYLGLAVDKNNSDAMNLFGEYYYSIQKYRIAIMCYAKAIEFNNNKNAAYNLGIHYKRAGNNHDLMKKMFIIASRGGHPLAFKELTLCYMLIFPFPSIKDSQNYFLIMIENNEQLSDFICYQKVYLKDILKQQYYNILCKNIDIFSYTKRKFTNIYNFKFCVTSVIKYICENDNQNSMALKSKYLNHYMKYIAILYYERSDTSRTNGKLYVDIYIDINMMLRDNASQLFMEYLDTHYYKYLEKEYAPDPPGPKYIKTKKHFETTIAEAKNNKIYSNPNIV